MRACVRASERASVRARFVIRTRRPLGHADRSLGALHMRSGRPPRPSSSERQRVHYFNESHVKPVAILITVSRTRDVYAHPRQTRRKAVPQLQAGVDQTNPGHLLRASSCNHFPLLSPPFPPTPIIIMMIPVDVEPRARCSGSSISRDDPLIGVFPFRALSSEQSISLSAPIIPVDVEPRAPSRVVHLKRRSAHRGLPLESTIQCTIQVMICPEAVGPYSLVVGGGVD